MVLSHPPDHSHTLRAFWLCLVVMFYVANGQARPSLIPLLWTQGQPPETIRKVVREVAEAGNTGFVWESRPHPDYLGPRWWSDLGVAIEEARKLGLEVWIFDEWMYPSGIAGGRVVEQNPKFTLHTILDKSMTVTGPTGNDNWRIPGAIRPNDRILSVVAFPDPYRDGVDRVDLTAQTNKDRESSIHWAVPPGQWRICWTVSHSEPPKAGWRMDNMIDVFNPEVAATFIRLTHEATWNHFRDDFGKTIKGFFSDETGFRNITSYKSLPGEPGMPLPWSPTLVEYFQRAKGYDPTPLLPALWYDFGPRGRRVRFDFMDVCTRGFAENFFKPQQEWCRAHKVKFIGHLVEDNHADHNLGYGPGHWFRCMRYFDMPGIDIVGYQITPGVDAGGMAWPLSGGTVWDEEFFQFYLPAMTRGAALLQGTREIFSEAFGANGWNEGLRMVKWIGDWHLVNGISVISPHAVTMKYHDPDCPPHFNQSSGNPQWRYYQEWSRYFRPLQRLISESNPVYDAAVLYTAESEWIGPADPGSSVVRTLETHQISTVVLPYEGLSPSLSIFPNVVLPYVKYVPASVLEQLEMYVAAGGKVFVLEAWPEGSPDGREDSRVITSIGRFKKLSGVVLTVIGELPGLMAERRQVRIEPSSTSLVLSRRKDAGGEWILLHNRSLSSSVTSRLLLEGVSGKVTRFESQMGRYFAVPARQSETGLVVDLEIPIYGLWCLRLGNVPGPVNVPRVFSEASSWAGEWQVSQGTGDSGESYNPLRRVALLSDWRNWPGLEHFSGTLRYESMLRIDDLMEGKLLGIDAGAVGEIAELKVNGQAVGVLLCPPYQWDITDLARPGENSISIEVTNTNYARWTDEFSHGDAVSGLLGPVRLLSGWRK